MLTTIIRNRLGDGLSTFCTFVDMQKAFDWVDRELLFFVLLKNGITGKVNDSVKALYRNSLGCVKINEMMTDWFDIKSGVRQGDPLSPTLFCIFVNELISEVKNLSLGVKVNDSLVSLLAFADDIVLLANTESELAEILKCVEKWCNKFRLKVNTDKTKIIHFRPKRSAKTNFNFAFNGMKLDIVAHYKYLGVILEEHLNYRLTAETLSGAAGRALGGVISKFKTLKNVGFHTYDKMYHTSVVSVMDYSSSIWGYNNYIEGDKIQYRAIRYFLGVHNKAALLGLEGEIAWNSFKIRQSINMVRLWNRLLLLDSNRLTRKTFDWDYGISKGWSKDIKQIFLSINLSHIFENKSVCDLRLVEKRLFENRQIEWKGLIETKPKLRTYILFKDNIYTENYVKIRNRRRRSLLAQVRLGILPICIETGRFRNLDVNERICEVCNIDLVEDEFHFICVCNVYSEYRETLFNKVENSENMSLEELFVHILKYKPFEVSEYIEKAWYKRKTILFNLV